MKHYRRVLPEELLDGFAVDTTSRSGEKGYVRRIESKSEYDAIVGKTQSPRGIIADGNFYLQTQDSTRIVHMDLLEFLAQQGIVKNYEYDDDRQDYNKFMEMFLTVQVGSNKKVYIGESYSWSFKDKIMGNAGKPPDENSFPYKMVKKHFKVLDKLKIPYEMSSI